MSFSPDTDSMPKIQQIDFRLKTVGMNTGLRFMLVCVKQKLCGFTQAIIPLEMDAALLSSNSIR